MEQIKQVYLRPGEFYFGDSNTQVRTILGSCIAITLWHKRLKIGGMCHYMLANPHKTPRAKLDGRYAEDAVALFMQNVNKYGTTPVEYDVKIFGGGNMFPTLIRNETNNIGQRNLIIGQELLKANGFRIQASHLGGVGYRRLVFDMRSGEVCLYHNENNNDQAPKQGRVV